MRIYTTAVLIIGLALFFSCCSGKKDPAQKKAASQLLGNPDYPAMSYGGYRGKTREQVPTVEELKEDLRILHAMGIRILRTYNTQQYNQAANLLKAIRELRSEQPGFEMYLMLGAWIDCMNAWTDEPDHTREDEENNRAEINAAVNMANEYPEIVKIIAVGNEAMVHWATNYYVSPSIILKWVNYLQNLKNNGGLPPDVWITSSDNYESWGGGDKVYHTKELEELIRAIDYISIHVYPYHETYYRPEFWIVPRQDENLSKEERIRLAIIRAKDQAMVQIDSTRTYLRQVNIEKAIHIGETGWASIAGFLYGNDGSRASDEYKQKLYYDLMRNWSQEEGMSCFYFEAFDEQWKDPGDEAGSENHFGLIDLQNHAKYALWDFVDAGVFEGLTRNGKVITKSYDGDLSTLLTGVLLLPALEDMPLREITRVNEARDVGEPVTEDIYLITGELTSTDRGMTSFPSTKLKLNAWEGTCSIDMSREEVIKVTTGTGEWWGCALEILSDGTGEDLTAFAHGNLNFEIMGDTGSAFQLGFQTGRYMDGTQTNNFIMFGSNDNPLPGEWKSYSIPVSSLDTQADLRDVTSVIYFRGDSGADGKGFLIRNLYYSK